MFLHARCKTLSRDGWGRECSFIRGSTMIHISLFEGLLITVYSTIFYPYNSLFPVC